MMSFGQPSWIAVKLVGVELARKVIDVRCRVYTYGSTSGPFGGIGGAAMTQFTIVALVFPGHLEVFCDDRPLGWLKKDEVSGLLDLMSDPSGRAVEGKSLRPWPIPTIGDDSEND